MNVIVELKGNLKKLEPKLLTSLCYLLETVKRRYGNYSSCVVLSLSYPELAERRNNSAFAALLLQVGNLSCMAREKK